MSDMQSYIIARQDKVASDMAQIIGRYKGSMEIFAEKVQDIVKNERLSDHVKFNLELLAKAMTNCVQHNEQLWDKRGQREAKDADPNTISLDQAVELFNQTQIKVTNQREATDVVQLERA